MVVVSVTSGDLIQMRNHVHEFSQGAHGGCRGCGHSREACERLQRTPVEITPTYFSREAGERADIAWSRERDECGK